MPKGYSNNEENYEEVSANKKKPFLTILVIILLIGSMSGFAWSYMKYQKAQSQLIKLTTPEGQKEMAKQEIDALVLKVSKHILLPTNEQPVVALIQNAEELAKNQAFYTGSKDGDQVLIYQQNAKAVIYNPREDILVNVGPIYIEKDQNQQTNNATDANTNNGNNTSTSTETP
jgi:hypothetical protein